MLEERYRLAKELNDGVIQDLVAAGYLLGAVEPDLWEEGSQRDLRQIERQLQGVVERLRTYLIDLAPMDWSEPDLYRGLELLVAEFQANALLPWRSICRPASAWSPRQDGSSTWSCMWRFRTPAATRGPARSALAAANGPGRAASARLSPGVAAVPGFGCGSPRGAMVARQRVSGHDTKGLVKHKSSAR